MVAGKAKNADDDLNLVTESTSGVDDLDLGLDDLGDQIAKSVSKGEDGRPRFFLTPEEVADDIKERRPQGRGVYLVAKVIWYHNLLYKRILHYITKDRL